MTSPTTQPTPTTPTTGPRDEAGEALRLLDPWLDLGIAHVVRLLTEHGERLGIQTSESCDGSPGHAYADPTVCFVGSHGAGWHALAICQDHGLPVMNLSREWQINDGEVAGPYWRITFRRSVTGGVVTPPMEGWYGVTTDD